MFRTILIGLILSVVVLISVPARAEFHGMSNFDVQYTQDTTVDPPQYRLEGFTFIDHNTPLDDLVLGESSGVVNVGGAGDITSIDDFDLNSFAPRNGATPPEFQTRNFGGSPRWQDTNGDGYDFFIFEAGRNDEFAVQAIMPGGVFGQKIVVQDSYWQPSITSEGDIELNRTPGPNNNQLIGGIAFKVTDLLDENGDPLTNESVIEGLQFTSPGMDPTCVCAVVGSPAAFNPDPADNATIDNASPVLTWSSGAGMVSQKVFFSEDLADVENRRGFRPCRNSRRTAVPRDYCDAALGQTDAPGQFLYGRTLIGWYDVGTYRHLSDCGNESAGRCRFGRFSQCRCGQSEYDNIRPVHAGCYRYSRSSRAV